MHIIWKWGSSNFKAGAVLTFWRFSLLVVKLHAFSGGTTGQTGNAILGCYQASARQLLTTNLSLPGMVTTRCWTLSPWQFIGQTSLHCTFVPCHVPLTYILFFKKFNGSKTCVFLLRGSYKLHDCLDKILNFTGKLEVMQKLMFEWRMSIQ